MLPLAAKFLLGGLGVAALAAVASSGTAKAGEVPPMPAELVDRMVAALARKDPRELRMLAGELRALGYPEQAQSLIAAAVELEKAQGKPPTSKPPAAGSNAPRPQIVPAAGGGYTLPSTAPISPLGTPTGPVQDARQLLAAEVARSALKTGTPDAGLVRKFQLQEGLTVDGKWGPKSAVAIIKYGIVPPTPKVWPKNATSAAQEAYYVLLTRQAATDPARKEEWQAAARKITAIQKSAGAAQVVATAPTAPVFAQVAPGVSAAEFAVSSALKELSQ